MVDDNMETVHPQIAIPKSEPESAPCACILLGGTLDAQDGSLHRFYKADKPTRILARATLR